jgi:hypothetical protein
MQDDLANILAESQQTAVLISNTLVGLAFICVVSACLFLWHITIF